MAVAHSPAGAAADNGAYRKVGDVSRCQYSDGGYLTKQIRNIVAGERIEFDIIEQSIRYAGSIALRGGTIRIESRGDGACSVEMLTRYELRSRWLRIARVCIDRVVSAMHRIVLRDMRVRLESGAHTSVRPKLVWSELVRPNRT
jgi:hypothetical protein